MGWQLHDSHSHSHGGISNTENINVRAAFIHVLGDVLQSIGVFIAALVIYFVPSWQLADPICTFIFSIVVLATTIAIMKDTLLVRLNNLFKFSGSNVTFLTTSFNFTGSNGRNTNIFRLQ